MNDFLFRRTSRVLSLLSLLGATAALISPANAMLDSTDHSDPPLHIAEAFGLQTPPTGQWWDQSNGVTVDEIASSVPANVLVPGETLNATFQVKNSSGQDLNITGFIEIRRYDLTTVEGDFFKYEINNLGTCSKIPVTVHVGVGQVAHVTCAVPIPAKFGGYALIMDLGPSGGRHLAGLCIRTLARSAQSNPYPVMTLDERDHTFLERIGIHAIRTAIVYKPTTDPDFPQYIANMQKNMDDLKAHHITAMSLFQGGESEYQALGTWAHKLNDKDQMILPGNDTMWMPSYDPDFTKFVKIVCARYGWPRGPITAVCLYNEPWEGGGISGWASDLPRYREAYTAMANGVLAARKDDHAQVLVGGTDSTGNAIDKLFPDGKNTFLPIFDFVSMHYQGLCSLSTFPLWHDRTGPLGRVRMWDTESWVANTDDRIVPQVASWRAAGYDRVMGVDASATCEIRPVNILNADGTTQRNPDGSPNQVTIPQASSVGAAEAASTYFLGDRPFQQILFRNGMPWVFVFGGSRDEAGKANTEDGTVVVAGDIVSGNSSRFRSVESLPQAAQKEKLRQELAALPPDDPSNPGTAAQPTQRQALQTEIDAHVPISGAEMIVAASPAYSLYDFYGNPQPASNGKIVVPLSAHGYFLRGNGKPGSFARLIAALRSARIVGLQPVEIMAHDMTAPIGEHPVLRLTVTNILNRPIHGSITAKLGALTLRAASMNVSIGPNETKDLDFTVTGGTPADDNSYPLHAKFDAGQDGSVLHDETMHCNVIAKRTITVDGDLSDWKGVLPQVVSTGSAAPSSTEQAWYPNKNFSTTGTGGYAIAYLAYDSKYFYFASKVADNTPDPGTMRFATRDDDSFFFPDTVYVPHDSTASQYSVRWSGKVTPKYSETYTFTTTSDDGARLWVDNKQIVNDWTDHGSTDDNGSITLQAGQSYDIKMEYYNDVGGGVARLAWESPSQPQEIVPSDALADSQGHAGGLTGQYYSGMGLSDLQATRTDATVNAEWGDGQAPIQTKTGAEFTALHWPAGVRHYIYRKDPVLPAGNGQGVTDNVLIGFNVIPEDDAKDKGMYPYPPGTMPHYIDFKDTDYEYALNLVAPQYGGGTEIWRLLTPGMPMKAFYPRQPKSPLEGPVTNGKLVATRVGNMRITEAAIPWSEMPWVKKRLDAGETVKFSYRVNDNDGPEYELAHDRSVSQQNSLTFHNGWVGNHWSNELQFGFGK